MIDDLTPEIAWGMLAVALSAASLAAYYHGIFRGKVKPHLFTWIIWTIMTGIAYAGQVAGGAGPGAWSTLVTALLCLGVVVVAFRVGEKAITRGDWVSFILGLTTIPLWVVTDSPLWSMILITLIDAFGFYPTIRKSWLKPWEESATSYALGAVKHVCALYAMAEISLVTSLYPASLVALNGGVVVLLLLRRTAMTAR